ncbi:MAG TPA: hypothetical protein VK906_17775 [Egicoccus sp.]|nr:hypothetical protein [Egicoccus sp.]HSK25039.1 hypothetical protein [Egicoccus sp.]
MASERVPAEDGNTLVLMPVAVLILLVLASLAFDAAVVHLQQRRLADLAASLANDAVAALDLASVYDLDVDPVADPTRAQGLAAARLAVFAHDATLQDVSCTPQVAAGEVSVTCEGRVVPVFGRALASERAMFEVRATEVARADLG